LNWKNNFPIKNRFFETENGILYHGDCLKIMEKFPHYSIDLILTDLPYGVTHNKWDCILPLQEMWKIIDKITKEKTAILLFGVGLFSAKLKLSNEKMWRYDLIWNKVLPSGFLNANRMPLPVHEIISVFYKKQPIYNPQKFKGKPNHSRGKEKPIKNNNYGKFKFIDNSSKLGDLKYPRSILEFPKLHPSKTVHPTQKPIDLLIYLINTYSNKNDIVLDFTCGSGSTLIASQKINRRWIGIEIEKEYCEITEKRLIKELNQLHFNLDY